MPGRGGWGKRRAWGGTGGRERDWSVEGGGGEAERLGVGSETKGRGGEGLGVRRERNWSKGERVWRGSGDGLGAGRGRERGWRGTGRSREGQGGKRTGSGKGCYILALLLGYWSPNNMYCHCNNVRLKTIKVAGLFELSKNCYALVSFPLCSVFIRNAIPFIREKSQYHTHDYTTN